MTVFIGGAWPYANGSLHLGHIAALLPGDILARYYRKKGEDVLYVSGSDCNGTPISIRAKSEKVTVEEIADRYHSEFINCFTKLGFSYDFYSRTDSNYHAIEVQSIFKQLLDNGYLYKKRVNQAYCEHDKQFLPDRFVEGTCPNCGAAARGDQCDNCSIMLDPLELLDKKCKICGNAPIIKETEHLYYQFSRFQKKLKTLVDHAEENYLWRKNAISFTNRYLSEGVPDRAVTRDLPNGVPVPVEGFEDKKIYVWIEAVSGYYTATKEWCEKNGKDLTEYWNSDTISYYVHGKDNIPFHTIIWPSVLMGLNINSLPTHIVSNEYLTLEKRKLSTSQNWAVWVPDFLEKYDPDSLRYFLTVNAPENRDSDFSWREYVYSHNSELLGAYGNFVNRTLKFIEKSFNGSIKQSTVDGDIQKDVENLYKTTSELIESGSLKKALEVIFDFVRMANKYFDDKKPWILAKEDSEACIEILYNCMFIITNLCNLLDPFLPFSSSKIRGMLKIKNESWSVQTTVPIKVHNVLPLFDRIDIEEINKELEKLNQNIN